MTDPPMEARGRRFSTAAAGHNTADGSLDDVLDWLVKECAEREGVPTCVSPIHLEKARHELELKRGRPKPLPWMILPTPPTAHPAPWGGVPQTPP